MLKIALPAALAAAALAPSAAVAQTVPAAVIAVVDLERVQQECTACKSARAALTTQANSIKARQAALDAPLETEAKAIQAAIDALKGGPADAALQNRVKAFETKKQARDQEIANRATSFQRNQAYVAQQLQTKLGPIYTQVMTRRGANIVVEIGTTLASGKSLDVTNDVLTALNAAAPSFATTAPAAPAQPQGR
ncbi:MAG TPA: OmpH family outer membrane protein [Sphingomicrobium sp.]